MKKKCNKKIRMIAAMIALAMIVQVFSPVLTAKAAAKKPSFPKDFYCYYEPKSLYSNEFYIEIENFPKNGTVTNVKSSKSNVVKASWDSDVPDCIRVKAKKPGTSKISFTLKYNGKTKKFNCKFVVRKYKNPCKSFKINGKNYASKFKNRSEHAITYKGSKKYKISLKAAKGWKLTETYFYNGKTNKSKAIKNNQTITCPKGKDAYSSVEAWFYNKKTREYICTRMEFRGK